MLADLTERSSLEALDPLRGTLWDDVVDRHPDATVFHSSAWARVLNDTYRFSPFYLASEADPSGIPAAICLQEVNSPLSGRRGSALPFTDNCRLLQNSGWSFSQLFDEARKLGRQRGWRSLEVRSAPDTADRGSYSLSFFSHSLDLSCGEGDLWKRFDGCVRRAIRKAQSSGVETTVSTHANALREYYRLHCLTRRKHGLPPQPFSFFENIARQFLSTGAGFIVLARLAGRAVAGAVFLHQKRKAIYKFGASNPASDAVRPNNLVMWAAIQHLVREGFDTMEFGRTSLAQNGLRRYKLNWGTKESIIHYMKWNFKSGTFVRDLDRAKGPQNIFFRACPAPIARLLGRLIYPHIA